MSRLIRIPWLVDIAIIDEPNSIKALNGEERIDRNFAKRGPLVNCLLQARLFRSMKVGKHLLPAFRPRHDEERAKAQAELAKRLNRMSKRPSWSDDDLAPLAAHVRGGDDTEALGIAVQQLVGRLFVPDYLATTASYEAACLLDAYPRANPIKSLWWRLSGRLDGARGRLSRLAGDDPHAIHATSIALHNIVVAIKRMHALYADPTRRANLGPDTTVQSCLSAPPRLIRRVREDVSLPDVEQPLRENGLVVFELKDAHVRTGATGDAFMAESWSACPAAALVSSLLVAVWQQANDAGDSDRPKEAAA